ncbi:RegA [Synechococcus phage S-CRM01]|uniref:translation repressor n=1 Tax=Synechococcus phage S-CRM01 TaxID=1026955 RepID=UPI000209E3E3|nr:translation repressor [Synechococcus phage S-CRM01]AEC53092.1 RegA [Synechococcus phage S-CRM01]
MEWTANDLVEVRLNQPDDFLKVRETLTRIGVASRTENKLYQSCHILHKQGKYYIVSFKELFLLDGKASDLSENDIQRRNRITKLLSDWGLVQVVDSTKIEEMVPVSQIKIIPFKEKKDWILEPKYQIGSKKIVG